ncbi:hypothetical protein [Chryseobacterium scophthalmum]|uniref:hypothetical protein n=1 Tax=Chryseobacterium scophthalmum TaxID=59733 RepID=UPI003D0868CD
MKTLVKMNNLDRAYLLAQLFPEELQGLIVFIKKEAELFNQNREQVHKEWTEKNICVNLWFEYITNFERRYMRNGTRLHRNKKTFRDQLFDGYDALFTIHATINYTQQKECSREFKYAIYMVFGCQKLIDIDLNPSS